MAEVDPQIAGTQLKNVNLKPGINKESTRLGAEGTWYSSDKVRFREGKPEKIGGWQKRTTSQFKGYVRDMKVFDTYDNQENTAMGTNTRLQLERGGTIYDITPIAASVSVSSNFNTSAGSTKVKVFIPSHGLTDGSGVQLSIADTTVGGNIVLTSSSVYDVSVSSNSAFYILTGTTAVSTSVSGGPSSGSINFLLAAGPQSNTPGFGWGAGTWGSSTWGTARAASVVLPMRQWTMDVWDQDLIAVPYGGRQYVWSGADGPGTRAVLVSAVSASTSCSAVPTKTNIILISGDDKHVIAFGTSAWYPAGASAAAFNPMLVRWSGEQDRTQWYQLDTNTAGELPLTDGTKIAGAIRTRDGILVLTDNAAYSMRYVGPPFTFDIRHQGTDCGIIGPHAGVDVNGTVYWMGHNNFYYWDGIVRVLPSTVHKYVFYDGVSGGKVNLDQKEKIFCGINSLYHEIWWLYQVAQTGDNTNYVVYNYEEKLWYTGTLNRTAWVEREEAVNPVAAGTDQYLYDQEVSINADGSAMTAYVESADFDLDDGQRIMYVDKFVPDFDMSGDVYFSIGFKKYPGSSYTTKGPYPISASTERIKFKGRGRIAYIMYQSSTLNSRWQAGLPRLAMMPDGEQ